MRNFYILLVVGFTLAVLIFISSFIYLDKEKRRSYSYAMRLDDHVIGTMVVDKYVTDEKTIYKSSYTTPLAPPLTESKSRLVLNKKREFESYQRDLSGSGLSEVFFIENKNGRMSFVSTFQAQFLAFKDLPIREGTFFLNEESPATFMPIIDRYDFKMGKVQGFRALVYFRPDLPPIRKVITLTSVRDEYIKIGSKYIKTECLVFKTRGLPQAVLWVAKSDKSLVRLEITPKRLVFTQIGETIKIEPKSLALSDVSYAEQQITFKNGDIELSGTITRPIGDGKFPALLLVGGDGPYDRNYNGLFMSLSDKMAKAGYCVMRFDKRGIGASKGSYATSTDRQATDDAIAAFDSLASQKEVDPDRMVIVGHAEGAGYAAKIASIKEGVAALVFMAPLMPGAEILTGHQNLPELAAKYGWGDDYTKFSRSAKEQSIQYVNNSKGAWTSILATRCYLEKIRDRLTVRGIDTAKSISIPALILQGNDDDIVAPAYAASLNAFIEEGGNKSHNLVSFDHLGHFFGSPVNDGEHKIYYNVDPVVSDMIKQWTGQVFAEKTARELKAEPAAEAPPTLEEVLTSPQEQAK